MQKRFFNITYNSYYFLVHIYDFVDSHPPIHFSHIPPTGTYCMTMRSSMATHRGIYVGHRSHPSDPSHPPRQW